MSFENWLKEHSDYPDFTVEEIKLAGQSYEAGAASRQGEIDELQKRIDLALLIVERMAKATNSTAMWSFDLDKELKGKKDE